jgi:hypothetical protein
MRANSSIALCVAVIAAGEMGGIRSKEVMMLPPPVGGAEMPPKNKLNNATPYVANIGIEPREGAVSSGSLLPESVSASTGAVAYNTTGNRW